MRVVWFRENVVLARKWNIIVVWVALMLIRMSGVWSLCGFVCVQFKLEFVECLFISCKRSWLNGNNAPGQGNVQVVEDFLGETIFVNGSIRQDIWRS